MGVKKPNDRYPGLRPFSDKENHLFFGRDVEINELLNLVVSEQVLVLFSKSGVGKSSLLYAGLFPRLKEDNYFPVRIRFQLAHDEVDPADFENTPLNIVKFSLQQYLTNDKEILHNAENPGLWELMKVISFPGKQAPILVFDQFEEFFNYTYEQRDAFLSQLCELVHSQPPNRILNWIGHVPIAERTAKHMAWVKQTPVKVIFAVRDDKLSELESIRKYIPLIFKNRFRLLPLSTDNAKEAITRPGKLDKVLYEFDTPKFTFEPPILNTIVERLAGIKNTENGLPQPTTNAAIIDGSQLQKVCGYIEKKIKAILDPPAEVIIDKTIIDPDTEVQSIIDNFYEEQLSTLGDQAEKARDIIESHFVVAGTRAFVSSTLMQKLTVAHPSLIEEMLEARLIKEENIHLGPGYELSHDTLIPSVVRSIEEKEKKRIEEEKNEAEKKLAEQQEQNRVVEKLKQEAESARDLAINEKIEAEIQRSAALKAKEEADTQRGLALAAKEEAEKQRGFALAAKEEADEARQVAQHKELKALEAEKIARAEEIKSKEAEHRAKDAEQVAVKALDANRLLLKKNEKKQRIINWGAIISIVVTGTLAIWSMVSANQKQKLLGDYYMRNAKDNYANSKHHAAFWDYVHAQKQGKPAATDQIDSLFFADVSSETIYGNALSGTILTQYSDHTGTIWDINSAIPQYVSELSETDNLEWSFDGKLILTIKDEQLHIWQTISGKEFPYSKEEKSSLSKLKITEAKFSPKRNYCIMQDTTGKISLLYLGPYPALKSLASLETLGFSLNAKKEAPKIYSIKFFQFSSDDRFLAYIDTAKKCFIYDLEKNERVTTESNVRSCSFSPSFPFIVIFRGYPTQRAVYTNGVARFITKRDSTIIRRLDTKKEHRFVDSNLYIYSFQDLGATRRATFYDSGNIVQLSNSSSVAYLYNFKTDSLTYLHKRKGPAYANPLLTTMGSPNATIFKFRSRDSTFLYNISTADSFYVKDMPMKKYGFSEDGDKLFTVDSAGLLTVFSTKNFAILKQQQLSAGYYPYLDEEETPTNDFIFNSDGSKMAYTNNKQKKVYLLDLLSNSTDSVVHKFEAIALKSFLKSYLYVSATVKALDEHEYLIDLETMKKTRSEKVAALKNMYKDFKTKVLDAEPDNKPYLR